MLFSIRQTLKPIVSLFLLLGSLSGNATAQTMHMPPALHAAEVIAGLSRSTVIVANHMDTATNKNVSGIRLVAHASRLMNDILAFINHGHNNEYRTFFYNGFWGAYDAAALARQLRSPSPEEADIETINDLEATQKTSATAERIAHVLLNDIFPAIETAAATWVAIDGWIDNPTNKNLRLCLQSTISLSRTLQICLENRHTQQAQRYLIPAVAHAVLTAWEFYQLHTAANQPAPVTTPSPVTVGANAASTATPVYTPRHAYFTEITGINEAAFTQLPKSEQLAHFVPNASNPRLNQIRNTQTGQTFYCGHLETLTIRDIRTRIEQMDKEAKAPLKGNGSFNVIARMDNNPALLSHVDIANIQAQPENRDAVIQAASNFNCMEANGDPTRGVTWWCDDWTQGPAVAISGGPGAIYRCYFHEPVNLLDQTPLPVANGKYQYGYLGATEFGSKNPVLTDADYLNIAIGYHHHVQVTYGKSDLRQGIHAKVTDNNQVVDQVYTAAANLAGFNAAATSWSPEQRQNALHTAQLLVQAAYEATIKAAYLAGKRRVYLTMVGGGVFNNPIEWIVNAINQNLPFIRAHDMEVNLVIFGPSATITQQVHNNLFAMTQQTNGTCRYYTTKQPNGFVRTT